MKNTILITGASGGIGKEFALVAAKNQNDVVLVARTEYQLKSLCEKITATYEVKADYVVADLSEYGSAEKLYEEVINRLWKFCGTQPGQVPANDSFEYDLAHRTQLAVCKRNDKGKTRCHT